jgi:predicted transcriptional regulator
MGSFFAMTDAVVAEIAAKIVSAYIGKSRISHADLLKLIASVNEPLRADASRPTVVPETLQPPRCR